MIHDHAVAVYTPQFEFNREQLTEILTLQASANDVMSTDWRTSSNDDIAYYRAAAVEAMEALCHIGYKWWKSETPDYAKIKLELIDILHFAASHLLREHSGNVSDTVDAIEALPKLAEFCAIGLFKGKTFSGFQFDRTANNPKYAVMNDVSGIPQVDMLEHYVFSVLTEGKPNWNMLRCLFDAFGMTPAQVHAYYVGKNALNQFRSDNGQRENTYKRMWNGREDNEHLYDFIHGRAQAGEHIGYHEVYSFLVSTYSAADLTFIPTGL
jgi:GrpB-like predicted nucleotidyltransferase (UPF0157 family)